MMKAPIILFVLLCCYTCCRGQEKKELPMTYFLNIPVTHTYTSMINFIATSSDLGIDSIVEGKGPYSSLKKSSLQFVKGNRLVKLFVNYALDFAAGNGVADTINSIMISYYFSNQNKSDQKKLHKRFLKDFHLFFNYIKHYSYPNSEWDY